MLRDYFTSGEAQDAAGVTQRQLAYWDRTGVIGPSITSGTGRGSRRVYSRRDLVFLLLAKQLVDAGMSLPAVRRSVNHLQQLAVPEASLSELVLVSDGTTIETYRKSELTTVVFTKGGATFVLPLGVIVSKLGEVRK